MPACIHCGAAADYTFRALPVRTLHLRELRGERRIQALGEEQECGVCRACAGQRLTADRTPGKAWRRLVPFAVIFAAGAVLAVLFWHGEGALRLLGLAAIAGGGMGLAGTLANLRDHRAAYDGLDEQAALARAAWLAAVDALPRKAGDEDLTYIPLNEKTFAMKNGDLMIEYELLPAIAKQAWAHIHERPADPQQK